MNEKKFIIAILFSLKLSNREDDNLFHKVRKNTNNKNISDSCTNDVIPECKCVNGPIKDDTALHKNNNYNQNTDEDSNSLSTASINNYKTSENNVVRTFETPNNKTTPTKKENF